MVGDTDTNSNTSSNKSSTSLPRKNSIELCYENDVEYADVETNLEKQK